MDLIKQRIAMAGSLGWHGFIPALGHVKALPPKSYRGDLIGFTKFAWIPYYNTRDEVIEAWLSRNEEEKVSIINELLHVVYPRGSHPMWEDFTAYETLLLVTATPDQLREAYLRGLGLWEEEG